MLQEQLRKLLLVFLGKVVENFSVEDMQLRKLDGVIEQRNIRLKREFLLEMSTYLGMPLILESSIIGTLIASIPWMRIWREPVRLTLKDIVIVCSTSGEFSELFYQFRQKTF